LAAPFETAFGLEYGNCDDPAFEQVVSGMIWANGNGVPKNCAEALKCFQRAAEQGNATAQCNIGVMYQNGDGMETDYAEAARWFLRASRNGSARAEFNIGVMYQNGYFVERDSTLAARWYRRAADSGGDPPGFEPVTMCQEGGVEQDCGAAAEWYLGAIRGLPEAQFNLGMLYKAGLGVSQDYVLAHMWIGLAASRLAETVADNLKIAEYSESLGLAESLKELAEKRDRETIRAERYAAIRDSVAARMNSTELGRSQRLADRLKKLAEQRKQVVTDIMTALRRSLELRENATKNPPDKQPE
jgi:TPR repeat protein